MTGKRQRWGLALAAVMTLAQMGAEGKGQISAAVTDEQISSRERENADLSRQAAAESMVLLENRDQVLPLDREQPIALFGMGAYDTVPGGSGSGNVNERYSVSVWEGFKNKGYSIVSSDYLAACRESCRRQVAEFSGSLWDEQAVEEQRITAEQLEDASSQTDTAVYVITRNSGEGTDRTLEKGDYYLSDAEKDNLEMLGKSFDKVIVVLNVSGVMDTRFFHQIDGLDALLLMSQAGMEGGSALVDVLSAEVIPSGKLTDTWAAEYEEYPSSNSFGANDQKTEEEIYEEGIYVGYRYFDTFDVTPAYAFGYGLSYTTFSFEAQETSLVSDMLSVKLTVKNTGDTFAGREVAQVYISAPEGELEKPYQELKGYAKTDLLEPGESQTVEIEIPLSSLASYSTDREAYILEPGEYVVRFGNDSRSTHVAAVLELDELAVTEQLSSQLSAPAWADVVKLSRKGVESLENESEAEELREAKRITVSAAAILAEDRRSAYEDESVKAYVSDTTQTEYLNTALGYPLEDHYQDGRPYREELVELTGDFSDSTLVDVYEGTVTMEEFVSSLTVSQMADIVVGGSKLPDANGQSAGASSDNTALAGEEAIARASENSVQGSAGETAGIYIESKKIPNMILADGPAGLRLTAEYEGQDGKSYYQYMTAWPVGTLLASSWDQELIERVGEAIAAEMEEAGVSVLLSPGMNIHRNPLCGRNFEYYSEDPLVSGMSGAALVRGIQSQGHTGACVKHFACNNQEANRTRQSSTVDERTLREIYLKGFEIAVKQSQPMTVMSSYNQINGIPTADNYDLLTDILRGEWGFSGLVMTDWGGGQSSPSLSLHAGNDLIMPGSDTRDITLRAFGDEEPHFVKGKVFPETSLPEPWSGREVKEEWGEFILSETGTVVLERTVSQKDYEKETVPRLEDGQIVYQKVSERLKQLGKTAWIQDNGDGTVTVRYRGYYRENNISLGDLQGSVIHILIQVMKTRQFQALLP